MATLREALIYDTFAMIVYGKGTSSKTWRLIRATKAFGIGNFPTTTGSREKFANEIYQLFGDEQPIVHTNIKLEEVKKILFDNYAEETFLYKLGFCLSPIAKRLPAVFPEKKVNKYFTFQYARDLHKSDQTKINPDKIKGLIMNMSQSVGVGNLVEDTDDWGFSDWWKPEYILHSKKLVKFLNDVLMDKENNRRYHSNLRRNGIFDYPVTMVLSEPITGDVFKMRTHPGLPPRTCFME